MKILFVSALYPPLTKGGGEVSTHLIARGLRRRGHDITIISSGAGLKEVDGVPVIRLAIPMTAKPLLERRHSRKVAKVLAKEIGDVSQYDVIHAHDYKSALALSELPAFAKGFGGSSPLLVATARDYAQVCGTTNNILYDGSRCTCSWRDVLRSHRVKEAKLPRKLARIWQYKFNIGYRKMAFRKFPAQIFISRAQQKEIARLQDLEKVKTKVIYNPVAERYLSEPVSKGIKGTVLYVGRVEMYKGVGLLLEAWKIVASALPNVQLKIVGDGAQRAEYERMVENWGLQYRVKFVARVPWDRMQLIYDRSDIVVAPHIWIEPFGRTVAEASARGKIVVAANAGGPREIIEDKITGLLFERGSVAELAEKLSEALTMPDLSKREMQKAARTWVARRLNMETVATQHEEFYQELVRG
ncbi:MAG: glycosyltransferase family 4 protein [bacterium]